MRSRETIEEGMAVLPIPYSMPGGNCNDQLAMLLQIEDSLHIRIIELIT
jgi:hypothetical protein